MATLESRGRASPSQRRPQPARRRSPRSRAALPAQRPHAARARSCRCSRRSCSRSSSRRRSSRRCTPSDSYEAFVATGTIGLLIPLNTMFARPRRDRRPRERRPARAARRADPALAARARQPGRRVRDHRAAGRRADRGGASPAASSSMPAPPASPGSWPPRRSSPSACTAWPRRSRAACPSTEEYIARLPAIAIVPWFLAGSLFPISALPGRPRRGREGACRSPTRSRSCATACWATAPACTTSGRCTARRPWPRSAWLSWPPSPRR